MEMDGHRLPTLNFVKWAHQSARRARREGDLRRLLAPAGEEHRLRMDAHPTQSIRPRSR
jgi:hypothetical protein